MPKHDSSVGHAFRTKSEFSPEAIVWKRATHFNAALLACLFCIAAATTQDSIEQRLNQAKSDYATAVEKAVNDLTSTFDRQIAAVGQTGDFDAVESLRTQRKAFLASREMPRASSMRTAAAGYQDTIISADASLKAAYDAAIEEYTKAALYGDAERVKQMKTERFSTTPADVAHAGPTTLPGDPILIALQNAKQEFGQAITDAHADVLAVIDAKAKAEADRGNLDEYKSLTELYAQVKAEIIVPDRVKDTEIRSANAKLLRIAGAAYDKLRVAYKAAIRDYTKARKIEEAEAVQTELGDGGWFEYYTGRSGEPRKNLLAKIRFKESMGYTVGTLVKGARTHNNVAITFDAVPEELVGKSYTLVVSNISRPIGIRFLTSGKIYLLVGHDTSKGELAQLSKLAQKDTTVQPLSCGNTPGFFSVWSITANAGAEVEIPFQVGLVAESLEKATP